MPDTKHVGPNQIDEVLGLKSILKEGGYSEPLPTPEGKSVVTTEMIKAAVDEAGWLIDRLDFSQIQWVAPETMPINEFVMLESTFRVFPHGEFGNRESEYVWGTVGVGLLALPEQAKHQQAVTRIYVKI
jgi:hypothetical protein